MVAIVLLARRDQNARDMSRVSEEQLGVVSWRVAGWWSAKTRPKRMKSRLQERLNSLGTLRTNVSTMP